MLHPTYLPPPYNPMKLRDAPYGAPVARALVELAAPSLAEVRHGTELAYDGSTGVPPAHEPLERRVGVLFIHELSFRKRHARKKRQNEMERAPTKMARERERERIAPPASERTVDKATVCIGYGRNRYIVYTCGLARDHRLSSCGDAIMPCSTRLRWST